MKHNQRLIDDEYESSNIASQKELRSISGNTNLNHTMYLAIPIYQLLNNIILWTSLSLTQKFKEYNRNNR